MRDRAYFFGAVADPAGDPEDYRRYVYEETTRLLAEISIAAGSERFVSSFRSNVGKTIRWLHPRPEACKLMSGTPELDERLERMRRESGKRQPLREG